VTKTQLAERLAPALQLSKEQAEKTIDAVFAAIVEALKNGEKLDIRGFGSFRVKDQPARRARNPRTGSAVAVPAKKVAGFKPGKELAEALNLAAAAAQSVTEHLHTDPAKQYVDFYGIDSQGFLLGIRVYVDHAQSIGAPKGKGIDAASAHGEMFSLPIDPDSFAPGSATGGDRLNFLVAYRGYMQSHPDSALDPILRGRKAVSELLGVL
jgi:nucleoid DNA-binding protein